MVCRRCGPPSPASPVALVLDAGNYQVVGLKTAVLGQVPVRFTGDQESFGDADGHVFVSRIFHAEHLVAGGLVVTQFDGNELVGNTGKAARPQDGLIGFGLLGRYQMVFDEPGGELRLYPSSAAGVLKAECGSEGGALHMERGVMVSDVQTGHGVFRVQWESGSAADVLRPPRSPYGSRMPTCCVVSPSGSLMWPASRPDRRSSCCGSSRRRTWTRCWAPASSPSMSCVWIHCADAWRFAERCTRRKENGSLAAPVCYLAVVNRGAAYQVRTEAMLTV